jgi:hypothetical protein
LILLPFDKSHLFIASGHLIQYIGPSVDNLWIALEEDGVLVLEFDIKVAENLNALSVSIILFAVETTP